jgi:acetyl-CoA carboxylase biotin carboxyl carrier protein
LLCRKQKKKDSMDLRKLKTLIDLVAESGISELEITEAEGTVRIVKHPAAGPVPTQTVMMQAPQAYAAPAPVASQASLPETPATPAAPAAPTGNIVKSPMVGTFYAASGPGKPDFAVIGAAVKPGDTLCIIEAMKLHNEIECEFTGVIKQILVDNGQPVEYGQPLFVIE